MKNFNLMKILFMTIIISLLLGTNPMGGVASPDSNFNDMPSTGNVFNDMDTQIDQFIDSDDIQDESTARALKLHLKAVKHFQKQGNIDKVNKHMQNFKILLDNQKSNKDISQISFDVLNTYTQYMIAKNESLFNTDNVMDHIKHLSVDIGVREAGSDAEMEGAEYIKKTLEDYGYDTSMEQAPRSDRLKPQLKLISNNNNNKEVPLRVANGSPETSKEGIIGNVYDAGIGQVDDFTEETVDKIALIQNGQISTLNKVENAIDAGAIGVIIYDDSEHYSLPYLTLGNQNSSIPVVGITKTEGESLLSQIAKEVSKVSLSIQTLTDQTTPNVIAVKKPKDVKNPEIYYVGAHLDSVPFSPGANDDGSGTATMMELARLFKDYDGDKELRFTAYGGEELGFVGSRHHVNNLSQDEIDRTQVQFQMDMVGTSWVPASQLYINTVDGEPNLVSNSTHEAADNLNINKDLLPLHQLSRSDHVPFHEKGVDSALFIWMEPDTAPGAANIEPYYHTPEDKIEHISPERLQLSGDVVFEAISNLISFENNESEEDAA